MFVLRGITKARMMVNWQSVHCVSVGSWLVTSPSRDHLASYSASSLWLLLLQSSPGCCLIYWNHHLYIPFCPALCVSVALQQVKKRMDGQSLDGAVQPLLMLHAHVCTFLYVHNYVCVSESICQHFKVKAACQVGESQGGKAHVVVDQSGALTVITLMLWENWTKFEVMCCF